MTLLEFLRNLCNKEFFELKRIFFEVDKNIDSDDFNLALKEIRSFIRNGLIQNGLPWSGGIGRADGNIEVPDIFGLYLYDFSIDFYPSYILLQKLKRASSDIILSEIILNYDDLTSDDTLIALKYGRIPFEELIQK